MADHEKPNKRNPAWTRDELLLALELYFVEPSARGDDTHSATQRLSEELNALPVHPQTDRSKLFRNANGVALKLANFKRFDPAYITRGRRGLSHGSELEEQVWKEFAGDFERLTRIARAIRAAAPLVSSVGSALEAVEEEATEGQILTRVHRIRERNRRLIDQKKKLTVRQYGRVRCEVCNFDFRAVYGDLGEHFIECHHTVPLSAEFPLIGATRFPGWGPPDFLRLDPPDFPDWDHPPRAAVRAVLALYRRAPHERGERHGAEDIHGGSTQRN